MPEHPTAQLIERLYKRSLAGQLKWQKTSEDDAFQAVFPSYSVRIVEKPGQGIEDYYLKIYDSTGAVVEEVSDDELATSGYTGAWERMASLFAQARRSARGADEAVRSILSALEDDDEIPF